ncbi:hypothetical protein Bca101_026691 [Brassica carinata]
MSSSQFMNPIRNLNLSLTSRNKKKRFSDLHDFHLRIERRKWIRLISQEPSFSKPAANEDNNLAEQ